MPKAVALQAGGSFLHLDAGCIEGSQAGYIRRDRENHIRLMPFSVREHLIEARSIHGHGRFYPVVNILGKKTGVDTSNYLDRYFSTHEGRLNEFIAHFERPRECIGVVVLIDQEIFGIERFPSFTFTAQIWDILVRDAYGALVIEALTKGQPAYNPLKIMLDLHVGTRLPALEIMREVHEEARDMLSYTLEERLSELLKVELIAQPDLSDQVFTSLFLSSEGYRGQVIEAGGVNHLVTLVRKSAFDPAALRMRLQEVSTYRAAGAAQRDFTL